MGLFGLYIYIYIWIIPKYMYICMYIHGIYELYMYVWIIIYGLYELETT